MARSQLALHQQGPSGGHPGTRMRAQVWMSLAAAALVSLVLACGGRAQEHDENALRMALGDDLTKIVRERFSPTPTVRIDGAMIRVESHVRPFQVHWQDEFGGWSAETRTELGPGGGCGFLIEIVVSGRRYSGAMSRPNTTADAFCPGTLRHGPYFDTYFSKTDFIDERGGLWTNIVIPRDSGMEPTGWVLRRLLERCAERRLLAPAASQPTSNCVGLRARDEQERVDAFFEYFGPMLGPWHPHTYGIRFEVLQPIASETDPAEERLLGQTTAQIGQLLGRPSSTWRCEERGHEWLEARYEFNRCPRAATADQKERYEESRARFEVRLYFRDRILVSRSEMWRERNIAKWSILPTNLKLREPTGFP